MGGSSLDNEIRSERSHRDARRPQSPPPSTNRESSRGTERARRRGARGGAGVREGGGTLRASGPQSAVPRTRR